jgi:hypothetical protein
MNSPNSTTMPPPSRQGRSIGRNRADQALGPWGCRTGGTQRTVTKGIGQPEHPSLSDRGKGAQVLTTFRD